MTDFPNRRSTRLQEYDYSSPGAYFVTLSVQDNLAMFGGITDDRMILNAAGTMIEREWLNLPSKYSFLELDEYVLMPNYFHGILCLLLLETSATDKKEPGEHKVRPYGTESGSIGRIIQAFKSRTTILYGRGVKEDGWTPFNHKLWQRGYYEHVFRNQHDLEDTREYINLNPRRYKHAEHSNLNTGNYLS